MAKSPEQPAEHSPAPTSGPEFTMFSPLSHSPTGGLYGWITPTERASIEPTTSQ
jgi:hypothetical protein